MDSFIDLNFSGLNQELNLLGDLNFFPSKKDVVDVVPSREEEKEMKKEKIFCCNYCTMTFSDPHAYCGHQNAHKKKRTLTKMRNPLGLPPNRFIDSCSYPFRSVPGYSNHYPQLWGSRSGSPSQLSILSGERLNAYYESTRIKANGLNSLGLRRNSLPEDNLSLNLWCGEKPPTSKSHSNNM